MTWASVKRFAFGFGSTMGAASAVVDLANGEWFSGAPETRLAVWAAALWAGFLFNYRPLKVDGDPSKCARSTTTPAASPRRAGR